MKDRTKTWVVNTRVDIRTLATLMKFYEAQGHKTQKKSTALRLAIEHFKSLVVLKHPEFETRTFQDAIEYLEHMRVLDMQSEFQGKFALVKELQKEGIHMDLKPLEPSTITQTEKDDMMRILDEKMREIDIQEDIPDEQETKKGEEES